MREQDHPKQPRVAAGLRRLQRVPTPDGHDVFVPGAPLQTLPPRGQRLSGLSRQHCYALLREGKLRGVKVGNRSFIVTETLVALIETLPPYEAHSSQTVARMNAARKRKAEGA